MALKVGELFASFGIDTKDLDSSIKGIESKCKGIADSLSGIGTKASVAITAPLTLAAKDIYNAGTTFDAEMSKVAAISGANEEQFASLRAAAIEMGSTTSFSAAQSAEALEYMAMAGWETEQMLDGLPGIMDLAAASGEDLGTVSDIVTDALTAFGMKAKDAGHFSDILAAASSNANTNVSMMGETFKYAAPIAGAMGYSAEDTALAIGLMANSGIKASQAGTSLRRIMTSLNGEIKIEGKELGKVSIQTQNADGSMRGFNDIVMDCREAFKGLSDSEKVAAAETLVGKNAMSGFLAIMNASDDDVKKLSGAINDCTDATKRMADTMLDNAKGDVVLFKSAIEGLEITLWGLLEGPFRTGIQTATGWVDSFRKLDSVTQGNILKIAGLAAAAGPAMIALSKFISVATKIGPVIAGLASPLGIVAAGLGLFAIAAIDSKAATQYGFKGMSETIAEFSRTATKSLKKVNKAIPDAMKGVSKAMPIVANFLTSAIKNLVPTITDTASLVVTGFMDFLADNATHIAKVGRTFITSFIGGISRNLPQLVPAAARMVTGITSALIKGVPELISAAGTLVKGLWEGLKNVDWSGLGSQLLDSLGSALMEGRNVLAGFGKDLSKAFSELDLSDVGAKIWEAVSSGFKKVSNLGKMLILGDSYTPDSTWADAGRAIWNAVKTAFSNVSDWGKQLILGADYTPDSTWGDAGGKIWDAIKNGLGKASELVKDLVLGEDYTADSSWGDVGTKIWNAIKGGIGKASDLLKELVLGEDYTPDSSWGDAGGKIWNSITTGISNAAAAVTDWLSDLVSYTPEGETWKTYGGDIWDAIVNGISVTGDWLKEKVGFDPDEISWSDIGSTIWETIKSGINLAGDWIVDKATTFTAGEGWNSVGKKIIDKIVSNQADKYANIGTLATDLITELVNWSGWSGLAVGFKQIATTIISSIAGKIPELGSVAVSIIENIGDLLSGEGMADRIGDLTSVATGILDAITSALSDPDLVEVGSNIASALGDALSSFDWESALTATQQIGYGILNAITAGINAATAIGDSAGDAVGDVCESLATAIGGKLATMDWAEYADVASSFGESVVNMIVTGAGNILDNGAKIAKALGDAFLTIDWNSMGTSAGTIFSNIWDAIVTGAKDLVPNMDGFFDSISAGIANGGEGLGNAAHTFTSTFLGHILDPENLEAFAKAGLAICKSLALGITELGVAILDGAVSVVEGVFIGLLEALGLSGWSEEAQEALAEVNEVVNAAGETLTFSTQEIVTQLQVINGAVQRGFTWDTDTLQDSVTRANLLLTLGNQELIDSIGDFETWGWLAQSEVTSLLATLVDTTASEADRTSAALALASLGYGDMFRNNIQELDAGTQSTVAEITRLFNVITDESQTEAARAEALIAMLDLGVEPAILENIPSFDGKISAALQALTDAGIDLTESGFSELAGTIPTAMETGINNGIPQVTAAAATIGEIAAAVDEQSNIEANATTSGEMADDGLETGIGNNEANVTSAMGDVVDSTKTEADRLKDLLQDVSEEAMTGYETSLQNGEAPASAAMDAVGTAVVNAAMAQMNQDTGYNLGNEFINGLTNGLGASGPEGKIASVASNVVSNARRSLSQSIGYSLGSNFSYGIALGIWSGRSNAIQAAIDVATAALASAKSKLAINSPSKVARDEIGAMFDKGLALGLLDNTSTVVSAAKRVTQSLRDSFFVGDPSRGTIYTAQQAARENGAASNSASRAKEIGTAIADRLIETDALGGDIIMGSEVVGRKVTKPVINQRNRDTNKNITGRLAQGVIS